MTISVYFSLSLFIFLSFLFFSLSFLFKTISVYFSLCLFIFFSLIVFLSVFFSLFGYPCSFKFIPFLSKHLHSVFFLYLSLYLFPSEILSNGTISNHALKSFDPLELADAILTFDVFRIWNVLVEIMTIVCYDTVRNDNNDFRRHRAAINTSCDFRHTHRTFVCKGISVCCGNTS